MAGEPPDDQPATARSRHRRNQAIVAAHRSGRRSRLIASCFGLTPRQVNRIIADDRAERTRSQTTGMVTPDSADPLEHLEALRRGFLGLLEHSRRQAPLLSEYIRLAHLELTWESSYSVVEDQLLDTIDSD